MQATAHFETDFMTMVADAKRESMEALGGFCGKDWGLIVSEPRSVAFIDAIMYVGKHWPDCDRRRHKREMRKALKKAYAGELPQIPVKITQEPPIIQLRDTTETVVMKGPIDAGSSWSSVFGEGTREIIWSQRPGGYVDLNGDA